MLNSKPLGLAVLLLLGACARDPASADDPLAPAEGTATAQTDDSAAADPGPKRLILLTGITGSQGGAAARHLLERGFPLRGLTRDLKKPEAQALRSKGVEMVQGDFSEPASIERAAAGVHGMFLNSPGTVPDETAVGIAAIDAARRAGVRHIVYTTYYHAHPDKGRPASPKWQVEQYLRGSGLQYTILRPGTFMENILVSKDKLVSDGFREARPPTMRQQFISTSDIGFFIAEAFTHPEEWAGREVQIATDEYAPPELAALYAEVLEQPVAYRKITWEQTSIPPQFLDNMRWAETDVVRADVTALRARYPDLMTYREFLEARWGPPAPK